MNTDELIEQLNKLIQLDIDAVQAYEQALKNIDIKSIHDAVASFRDDHKQHITDLSKAVKDFGGTPPDISIDFKGFLIQGFTAIRSLTGTEGALKAMQSNEKLTNSTYASAMQMDFPENIKKIVEKNYGDEKRHLQYIEYTIKNELWVREDAESHK